MNDPKKNHPHQHHGNKPEEKKDYNKPQRPMNEKDHRRNETHDHDNKNMNKNHHHKNHKHEEDDEDEEEEEEEREHHQHSNNEYHKKNR